LKRNISLVHLIGIEVGQSIGAGTFALTGIALAATGPSLFLAFLAAAVPVALAMAVLAMLATAEPISGGTYYYGSRLFSPVASFTGVWAYILGAVLGMFPLYALTGAAFLKAVIPGLPKIPVALLLLAIFFTTNLLGAKIAIWVQAVLVGILLLALFLFLGAGLPEVEIRNLSPLFAGGVGGFLVASAILTFTILGANAAVELGDEIIHPRRNHHIYSCDGSRSAAAQALSRTLRSIFHPVEGDLLLPRSGGGASALRACDRCTLDRSEQSSQRVCISLDLHRLVDCRSSDFFQGSSHHTNQVVRLSIDGHEGVLISVQG